MSAFPGMPGIAPAGTYWVPGHYEVKDGNKVWVRGHYQKIKEDAPMLPNAGGPATIAGQFTPGHFEIRDGQQVRIRGHYPGEEGTVAGPPGEVDQDMGVSTKGQEIRTKEQPGSPFFKGQGWAVVIGISKYKHAAGAFPEVRYAAKDAEAFYNFLRSPQEGGFSPDHILFMQDEKATLENIKYAFFDFLKQALEEDFIVIYFSGHGTPEEDNPKNLYLMAYDSRPDRVASTAFPMWDVYTALNRHISSEKVIVFADACHSAGITSNIATRSIYKKNMVSKYLLEVAKAKKGRAIFTASEAGELSQESKQWGGGHGVFTHFLIQGMQGEADVNNDNIVTLGEVIDFVSENVRRATNNTQHPDTAGVFDREFPLAMTR